MSKPPRETPEQRQRRLEWHGWSFRNYTPEQCAAIQHYIATGERTPDLP